MWFQMNRPISLGSFAKRASLMNPIADGKPEMRECNGCSFEGKWSLYVKGDGCYVERG